MTNMNLQDGYAVVDLEMTGTGHQSGLIIEIAVGLSLPGRDLATSNLEGDGAEATRLAERAVQLGDTAQHRDTLAAAYAEAGQYPRAVKEEERAIALSHESGRQETVASFRKRLEHYRRGQPFRQR